MKALIYTKKAKEKFSYADLEKPTPKANQVLIKTAFTSINAADYRSIKMGMIPKHKIYGASITGVIDSIGKDVRTLKIGDEVLGDLSDSGFGGLAEYVVADEDVLLKKPPNIPFEIASAIPLAATTALAAFRKKEDLKKGQKALILGSAGGVGTYAVQLAKLYGLEVTGVCSSRNVKQTLTLGADKVIDYSKDRINDSVDRYDLILAINGNYALLSCIRLLNKNGVYVAVGGSISQIFKTIFFGRILSIGSKKIRFLAAKANTKDLKIATDLVVNEKIFPVIEKTYALKDAGTAMDYCSKGHAKAKIVIKITD